MKKACFLMTMMIAFALLESAAQSSPDKKQPMLGYRSAKLINVGKLQFKDLNRNGKLDAYEDWRLSNEARAKNLLSQMSVEQKVGFMLISTTRLKNDRSFDTQRSTDSISSDFNEEDQVQSMNMFTRKPLPLPMMRDCDTSKGSG
jgi:beta-glucosidase